MRILNSSQKSDFVITVRGLCGLFVTIIDSKIYLPHQTAKEFLVRKESLASTPLQWKNSLLLVDSNCILSKIYIWYLPFTVFESYALAENGEPNQYIINRYINNHLFLDYSTKN
jgi:hypothetical protein